jgi:hypothetical protein
LLVTGLAMLAATSAWAAEDVFHAIPSNALAFVAVNRIADTNAKIEKLSKQLVGKPLKPLDMIQGYTGEIKGLDDTRGAALVVMPAEEAKDPPSRVLLLPVSDYKQFLESWDAKPTGRIVEVTIADEPMLIGRRGEYAALSRKEVAGVDFRPGLENLLSARRSIADKQPQMLAWLNENEVVAVATSHGVKWLSGEVQEQLRRMKEAFAQMNVNPDWLAGPEMYATVFQVAEKEVDCIGIGARVDKQGDLRLTKRIRFTKNSEFGPSLAKLPPVEKGPLAAMPAGPFVLVGGGPWSDSLVRNVLSFQSDFMKRTFRNAYDIDEKQADELATRFLEMPKGIHSASIVVGPVKSGEPPLSNTLALCDVDDAPKYLNAYEKYLAAMNEPGKDAGSAKKLFPLKRMEVGGRPALENEMETPLSAKAAATLGFGERIGKLFGSGGKMKILRVAIDDRTIAISFTGRTSMILKAIASLKQSGGGLASDAEIAKTAALLPADAQWIGYVSPSRAVAFYRSMRETAADVRDFHSNGPEFPRSQPIGVAAKATAGELQVEAVVPSSVLDAIGKYIAPTVDAEHSEAP